MCMKGQTYLIVSIIFVIIISVFAVLNIAEVEVNYLFWSGKSPLIFVILFSVLLGGILAMIVSSRKYLQLKRENKHLKEQLRKSGVKMGKTTTDSQKDSESKKGKHE